MNKNIVFSQSVLLPSGKRKEVEVEKVVSRYSRSGYAYKVTGSERSRYSSYAFPLTLGREFNNKNEALKFAKKLIK